MATEYAFQEYYQNRSFDNMQDEKNDCFDELVNIIHDNYSKLAKKYHVYSTDVKHNLLEEAYLNGFENEQDKFIHDCRCCLQFIHRQGSLVFLTESFKRLSIWTFDDINVIPLKYRKAVQALENVVLSKEVNITNVFFSDTTLLGQPQTGRWTHFYIDVKKCENAISQMNEILSNFNLMKNNIEHFQNKIEIVKNAITLLKSGTLLRSEKVLPNAEWFVNILQRNLSMDQLWSIIAIAPNGFCHIRSSMFGNLLSDFENNIPIDLIISQFNAKMDPLLYQRAQIPPKAGNIAQANKIIDELGVDKSFHRRYARLDEIEKLWPDAQLPNYQGEVKITYSRPMIPGTKPIRITWKKFQEQILPNVRQMFYFTAKDRDEFAAFVTAKYLDSPAIIQWDQSSKELNYEEPPVQRNPFSWYFWTNQASPIDYNLKCKTWNEVSAITLKPSMWYGGKFPQFGMAVMFVLKDAREMKKGGCGLFTEFLKKEYHCIRSSLEEKIKNLPIEDREQGNVCGIMLSANNEWQTLFKVITKDGLEMQYNIDRWD